MVNVLFDYNGVVVFLNKLFSMLFYMLIFLWSAKAANMTPKDPYKMNVVVF